MQPRRFNNLRDAMRDLRSTGYQGLDPDERKHLPDCQCADCYAIEEWKRTMRTTVGRKRTE